jgi:hypothetical protein
LLTELSKRKGSVLLFWLPAAALLPREGGEQENVNAGNIIDRPFSHHAPTASRAFRPSGSCWFVGRTFFGQRTLDQCRANRQEHSTVGGNLVRKRSISCRACQADFGSERKQTIHEVRARGVSPIRFIARAVSSLTVIWHLMPTIRSALDAEWLGQRSRPWRTRSVTARRCHRRRARSWPLSISSS